MSAEQIFKCNLCVKAFKTTEDKTQTGTLLPQNECFSFNNMKHHYIFPSHVSRCPQVVFSSCELGVYDVLLAAERPLSAEEISEAVGASLDGTQRLLAACAGLQLLNTHQDDGRGRCTHSDYWSSEMPLFCIWHPFILIWQPKCIQD